MMNDIDDVIVVDYYEEYEGAGEDLVFIGPLAFRRECLRKILRIARAYSKSPGEKEVCFILLGNIRELREIPVFIVEDYVQLYGVVTSMHISFDLEDVKKIVDEVERDGLTIVGVMHTHPRGEAEPSIQDKISWLILQCEMGRPIPFLIYSQNDNKIGIVYIDRQLIEQLNQKLKTRKINIGE